MIIINSRFLSQEITGVQRFAVEVCKELKKTNLNIEFVAPNNIIHKDLEKLLEVKKIGFLKGHLWEQITLQLYAYRKKALLISLCNTAPLFIKNQIVTIHDLSFKLYPQWNSKVFSLVYNKMIPIIAKKSRCILTVSETSKNELIKVLNIPREKINVIYNAVSSVFIEKESSVVQKKSIVANYILTVSSFHPRKNLKRLIEAFQNITDHNLELYIIGNFDKNFTREELNINVSNSRIKILTNIKDQELKKYYKEAKLFVYSSLYEGFGIPIIEAMSCDIPVCVSNINVFKEVCGENATYFDPYNIDDIKNKILTSLKKPKKTMNGFEKYSWKNSAQMINDIVINLKS